MARKKRPYQDEEYIVPEINTSKPEIEEDEYVEEISQTVIGEGMVLVGDFIAKDPIIVKGELRGRVSSNNVVVVERGGLINGGVDAKDIVVNGDANGKFVARNVCHITNSGNLRGKLITARIQADENAFFDGELSLPAEKRNLESIYKALEESSAKATPVKVESVPDDDAALKIFENFMDD